MHNYREILKAKAAALAYEAEFGADETIKLVLEDLVKFGGHVESAERSACTFEKRTTCSFAVSETGESQKLRTAALNAVNKLESLGRTFSGPHFTDRYGDGPHCLMLAKELKEALK
jgi:hypothetical protein